MGALFTSLIVTPLDVIKTRLQVQAHEKSNDPRFKCTNDPPTCQRCKQIVLLDNGLMEHRLKYKQFNVVNEVCRDIEFKNSIDAAIKIVKYEGISHLYTGLGVFCVFCNKHLFTQIRNKKNERVCPSQKKNKTNKIK